MKKTSKAVQVHFDHDSQVSGVELQLLLPGVDGHLLTALTLFTRGSSCLSRRRNYLRFWYLLGVIGFLAGTTNALQAQTTIRVPVDQPTIQAGINAARNGDTVLVAPGTYYENIDFLGKGITVTSGAKTFADAASVILNAVSSGPVVSFLTGEPASAVLNGFTVQGGYLLGVSGYAAGIAISGSSPTVSNNVIQKNIGCGIIVGNGASPLIEGNDIRQNRPPEPHERQLAPLCGVTGFASDAGGGITVLFANSVVIENNIIELNTLLNTLGSPLSSGMENGSGGIFVDFTQYIRLTNNLVRNNQGFGIDGFNAPFGAGIGEIDLFRTSSTPMGTRRSIPIRLWLRRATQPKWTTH